MVYRTKKRRILRRVPKKVNVNNNLIEFQEEVSEFSLQCTSHNICSFIFTGFPVFYRALENSIPLGGAEIKRAQSKLTAKGCNKDDPDYLIVWRDADMQLQAVFIEFKKKGKNPGTDQKQRHHFLFELILVKTEIVHTVHEFWEVVERYKIPNRGKELI